MAVDVDKLRARFPSLALRDDGRQRLYFDNPAGTQVPDIVVERMRDSLVRRNANIGGYFETSRLAGEAVDGARRAMADFLNAPSPEEIVFGQNMTSLTLHLSRSIGRALQPGDAHAGPSSQERARARALADTGLRAYKGKNYRGAISTKADEL